MNKEDRALKDKNNQETYARLMEEWRPFEDHMKNREIKQSSESSSTLIAYAKTPTNSPSPTATIRGAAHPNISPPAFIKPPISNNTNNAINTSVDVVDTKASAAKDTHSFFSFSLLKTSKPLIRKDSSLSNEVNIKSIIYQFVGSISVMNVTTLFLLRYSYPRTNQIHHHHSYRNS